MNHESGALALHAIDGKAPAMAVEDVLDERQAEARSALCAALGDVDPIEPLGQPRQVFGCDPGTVVAHRHDDLAGAAHGPAPERHVDSLAGSPVFERVLDQVLEHTGK